MGDIGALKGSSHAEAGTTFLDFLRSPAGQDIYAKYGFVRATNEQLMMKPID
jgi:ABC-type Fe3+ transport system substrate-binding protein